jgi:hypothetical protein
MRIFFLSLIFCVVSVSLRGQQEDPALSELLENFFRDNEGATESDAQLFVENIEILRQKPLDLNRAERDELFATQLLNELQVEGLLAYRAQQGNLLSVHELQAVPNWEMDDIRRVLPYVQVPQGGLDERSTSVWQGLREGDSDFLMRWGRAVPIRDIPNAEGTPNAFAMRLRHNFDNRLRYGFLAENDAGEAFFRGSNRLGFDFYSVFFSIQNPSNRRLRTLVLGDYTVRLGQGVLIQTRFAASKSAESTTLLRGTPRLRTYGGAFGEAFFLRGGGVVFSPMRHVEVVAFGSHRRRDANINIPQDTLDFDPEGLVFTSIQASGLHRTPAEVADERAIGETVAGGSLTYQRARGHVALNAVHIRYDRDWQPDPAAYRRYEFTGRQLTGLSIDYQYRTRNFLFFGENARSDNGGTALLNSVVVGTDRRVRLAVLHRRYAPEYQSIMAAPFGETAGANNEEGLYFGLEMQPSKPWKINAYADAWRHRWLRFGVSAPSAGHEYLLRVTWQPTKTFATYAIWQTETKQRDAASESPLVGIADNQRQRLRLHATYRVSSTVDLRSRVEWMFFREGNLPRSRGFLAYQEVVAKRLGFPLSGSFRYTIFDTDNFDTRVYAFENDLFAAISIPALSGRGVRYYCNLSWRMTSEWRLEARFETTYRQTAVTNGTTSGRQSMIKLQVRGRW